MPRTRQQRRAHSRRPVSPRRRSGRWFAASMVVMVIGGGASAYYFIKNPPPPTRGAIAGEHWHAGYRIYICGKRMTNYPTVEGEIHSHGDGFMHIHPQTDAYTLDNANVGTFLALYETQIGTKPDGKGFISFPDGQTYQDGDKCPNGKRYKLELLVNGKKVDGDPSAFTPHDNDKVVIRFGKEGTGAFPNPYAKIKGLPDPGFGGDTPQGDSNAPAPVVPQIPSTAPPTEPPAPS